MVGQKLGHISVIVVVSVERLIGIAAVVVRVSMGVVTKQHRLIFAKNVDMAMVRSGVLSVIRAFMAVGGIMQLLCVTSVRTRKRKIAVLRCNLLR